MANYAVGDLANLISGGKGNNKGKLNQRKRKSLLSQNGASKKAKNGKEITLRNGRQVKLDGPIFNNKKIKSDLKDKVENESDDDDDENEASEVENEVSDDADLQGEEDSNDDQEESGEEQDNEESDEEQEEDSEDEAEGVQNAEIKTDSESEGDDDNEGDDDDAEDLDELLAQDESDAESVDDAGEEVKPEKAGKKGKEEKPKREIPAKNSPADIERNERTVFVGNLPVKIKKNQLKALFKKFGTVECVRLRCVPVSDTRVPKKVAMIKKDFHPERKSLHAFVRFEKKEYAVKALQANGMVYKDHHLRVNMSAADKSYEENKSIFIGNIPFNAEEDELWKIFEPCGKIVSVRLVRDSRTMIGKGFGYVNFESSDAVALALEMTDVKIGNREIRIKRCDIKEAKKKQTPKKQKGFKKNNAKKQKEGQNEATEKPKSITIHKKAFQGKVSDNKKNKKNKKGKTDPKMKMAKQIAPKEN